MSRPLPSLACPSQTVRAKRKVRDLLDGYKERLREFFALVGVGRLRTQFGQVAMETRVTIARDLLNMLPGDKNRDASLAKRMTEWERGSTETLNITDIKMVTILQLATGHSDSDLFLHSGHREVDGGADDPSSLDWDAFWRLHGSIDEIRRELARLIYLPRTVELLQTPEFGTRFDASGARALADAKMSHGARADRLATIMAGTFVGLYGELSSWYRRVGEGRVETIKAVIEAERGARHISGTIVFDNARRILWKTGIPAPGYEGVGGLFGQMLGDERFLPVAVLSNEMYIGYDAENPLPPRISDHVESKLMQGEIARAIFALVTQGMELPEADLRALRDFFNERIAEYIPTLVNVRAVRPGDFSKRVLRPIRREVKRRKLGTEGDRLITRLDLRNIHLMGLGGRVLRLRAAGALLPRGEGGATGASERRDPILLRGADAGGQSQAVDVRLDGAHCRRGGIGR